MRLPHEEALAAAAFGNPLLYVGVLGVLDEISSASAMPELRQFAMRNGIPESALNEVLLSLKACGLLQMTGGDLKYVGKRGAIPLYISMLRGVAHGKRLHRDANEVEIVLSPPAKPSQLMAILPNFGPAWATLENTQDSLIALASKASRRFVILSPFIDTDGIEWIGTLFAATSPGVVKTLIVRGEKQIEELRAASGQVRQWDAAIRTFSVSRDGHSGFNETFHAKILLADSSSAYIGSANMNRASRATSLECGTVVSGPAVRAISSLVDAMCTLGGVERV